MNAPTYQPKGSMCMACEYRARDCSELQFALMPVIQREANLAIVKCTGFKKPADEADAAPSINLDDLHTLEGLAQQFPTVLTLAALKWQVRHRDTNGLAAACVRIGKRLLVSRSRYESWLAAREERN